MNRLGMAARGAAGIRFARRGQPPPADPAGRLGPWVLRGRSLALAAAALLVAGCGSYIHLPDRVAETQAQVTDLQRRQEQLAREIAELKTLLAQQEDLLRQARADQNTRHAELMQTIEVIRNQLEVATRQWNRGVRRPANDAGRPDTSSTHPAARDTSSTPALEEQGLYQAALQHLQQGRYPLAISGFREYLSKFPDGTYADEAQYGIAEAYYAQSDFPTAAIEFRALVDRYPSSDKVPAALLKAGSSYFESGKEDVGRAYLERVINEYPYSDEALRAKDRLERRR
jgi:tol-pal system protein YbgF